MRTRSSLTVGLGGLLLVAAAGQFLFFKSDTLSSALLDPAVLLETPAGSTSKPLEIAGTESINKAVEEGLGFSDYRYREYRSSEGDFSVYLAYWQAKKRHFLDIGSHAPDNCWVTSGWSMDPKLPKYRFILPSGQQLWPAEARHFKAGGTSLNVVYWHLLNGLPVDYQRYGTGKTFGFIGDNISSYWKGTGEQYFLRIATTRSLADLEKDPAFMQLLSNLVAKIPLGISGRG